MILTYCRTCRVPLRNLSSVHVKQCEETVKQTPNQSPIFAIFVEYLGEKNMVDVYIPVISSTIPLSVRIESQMKFVETSLQRLLLFF